MIQKLPQIVQQCSIIAGTKESELQTKNATGIFLSCFIDSLVQNTEKNFLQFFQAALSMPFEDVLHKNSYTKRFLIQYLLYLAQEPGFMFFDVLGKLLDNEEFYDWAKEQFFFDHLILFYCARLLTLKESHVLSKGHSTEFIQQLSQFVRSYKIKKQIDETKHVWYPEFKEEFLNYFSFGGQINIYQPFTDFQKDVINLIGISITASSSSSVTIAVESLLNSKSTLIEYLKNHLNIPFFQSPTKFLESHGLGQAYTYPDGSQVFMSVNSRKSTPLLNPDVTVTQEHYNPKYKYSNGKLYNQTNTWTCVQPIENHILQYIAFSEMKNSTQVDIVINSLTSLLFPNIEQKYANQSTQFFLKEVIDKMIVLLTISGKPITSDRCFYQLFQSALDLIIPTVPRVPTYCFWTRNELLLQFLFSPTLRKKCPIIYSYLRLADQFSRINLLPKIVPVLHKICNENMNYDHSDDAWKEAWKEACELIKNDAIRDDVKKDIEEHQMSIKSADCWSVMYVLTNLTNAHNEFVMALSEIQNITIIEKNDIDVTENDSMEKSIESLLMEVIGSCMDQYGRPNFSEEQESRFVDRLSKFTFVLILHPELCKNSYTKTGISLSWKFEATHNCKAITSHQEVLLNQYVISKGRSFAVSSCLQKVLAKGVECELLVDNIVCKNGVEEDAKSALVEADSHNVDRFVVGNIPSILRYLNKPLEISRSDFAGETNHDDQLPLVVDLEVPDESMWEDLKNVLTRFSVMGMRLDQIGEWNDVFDDGEKKAIEVLKNYSEQNYGVSVLSLLHFVLQKLRLA